MSLPEPESEEAPAPISFDRAICGLDPSPQSIEAVRQAFEVTADDAPVWAVSVWDPALAIYGGIHASMVKSDLRRQGASALEDAHRAYPALKLLLVRGSPVAGLLYAGAEQDADLISVGSHGTSRIAGITFGSVATGIVHHAPCSVLVARHPKSGRFPGRIIQAADGSPNSRDAAKIAGQIAARHGSEVITIHVEKDPDRGRAIAEEAAGLINDAADRKPRIRLEHGSPERAIVELSNSAEASLVVLGSRGLTGVKALGSVSERVAHRASCSVLIVRRKAHPEPEPELDSS